MIDNLIDIFEKNWDSTKEYPYAGLDFLIDSEYNLVFLEANAVPGGIYVMDRTNDIIRSIAPSLRKKILSINLVKSFVDMCIYYHNKITNQDSLSTVIVTTPIAGSPLLMPERSSIAQEFKKRNIDAFIVDRSKYFVKRNDFFAKIGSKNILPDIIVRRNTSFPKNIRQPTINKSEIGIITGSKFRTYNVVMKKSATLLSAIRIPKTFYAKDPNKALILAEEMLKECDEIVIKPNRGEGGQDILFISNISDVECKLKRTYKGKKVSLLVQEAINTSKIRIDGKKYAFDIRVYAYLGELVGLHIRRAVIPISSSKSEISMISNISRGGRYVPVIAGDSLNIIRWSNMTHRIYPFKKIIVDKYAAIFDECLFNKIKYATKEIVRSISLSLNEYLNGAKNA